VSFSVSGFPANSTQNWEIWSNDANSSCAAGSWYGWSIDGQGTGTVTINVSGSAGMQTIWGFGCNGRSLRIVVGGTTSNTITHP